jgi:hypothetical protein
MKINITRDDGTHFYMEASTWMLSIEPTEADPEDYELVFTGANDDRSSEKFVIAEFNLHSHAEEALNIAREALIWGGRYVHI